MKYKNYCICKRKKNYIERVRDCPATYIHNGKKFVEITNMKAFREEMKNFNADVTNLC